MSETDICRRHFLLIENPYGVSIGEILRRSFLLILFISQFSLFNSAEAQGFSLDWHGFVNPHYYADSRSVVGGREDMMLFYPKPILRDSLGHDINDGWQANMLAITARLGLTVKGPEMLGANTMAYIEGDFTGSTNATINNLRLRHAYLRLNWDSHELTVGQYWYAMVVHEIMPMTNPLNMGAPFHCYARQPQVRYSYFPTGNWELLAVAQWQLDNMSQGLLNGVPQSSTLFARHSLVPELNAQIRYHSGKIFVGAAVNAKTTQPAVNTTGMPADGALYTSLSYSAFGSLTLKGVTFKAQTLLNNSLYEGCSLGGYLMLADSTFQDWHFNTVWRPLRRLRPQPRLRPACRRPAHLRPRPRHGIPVARPAPPHLQDPQGARLHRRGGIHPRRIRRGRGQLAPEPQRGILVLITLHSPFFTLHSPLHPLCCIYV